MITIDGHAHACGVYLSSRSVKAYLDLHGIDKVVLCGGEPRSRCNYGYPMFSNLFRTETLGYMLNKIICGITKISGASQHMDEQNHIVWQMAEQLPNRIINAYWVNPLESDYMDKMVQFHKDQGFKLIKLHQCWTNFDIGSRDCEELFQWALKNQLPVFIHLLSMRQVQEFTRVANRFRENVFIVAHMIGVEYMSKRLTNENVYFDLSAPQLYSFSMLKEAYSSFGAKRLVLGSDTPYGKDNIPKVKERLHQLALSEKEQALIMGLNILGILGLAGPGEQQS